MAYAKFFRLRWRASSCLAVLFWPMTARPEVNLVPLGPFHLVAQSFADGTGWASDQRRSIWHTTDEGRSWRETQSLSWVGAAGTEVRDQYFASGLNAWVLLATGASRVTLALAKPSKFMLTRDGGRTWTAEPIGGTDWTINTIFSQASNGRVWLGGSRCVSGDFTARKPDCPQHIREP